MRIAAASSTRFDVISMLPRLVGRHGLKHSRKPEYGSGSSCALLLFGMRYDSGLK